MTTALQVAQRLVDLAEEGCVIAAAGRLDELAGQQAGWDAAVAALREHHDLRAPQVAALLERARELQGEQAAILAAAQSEVAAELGRLRRTRTGAQGYAAAGLAGPAGGLSATA